MSAWIQQLKSQVDKHGADKASWYALWKEPHGNQRMKSFGPGSKGKRLAERFAEERKAELLLGTYDSKKRSRTTWTEFVDRYEQEAIADHKPQGRVAVIGSLRIFAQHMKLSNRPVSSIDEQTIDTFIRRRRNDRGKKPGSKVSAATINRDLRHLSAALKIAKRWKFLSEVPEIVQLKEPKLRKNFVSEDHFLDIYKACDAARLPVDLPYSPGQWWRGLLTFAYLTGWRIGECLSLVWDDVSLDEGYAITRAKDNKGNRDESIFLHQVAVEHLRSLWTPYEPLVFPWELTRRPLYVEFSRIQDAAGIELPCIEQRDHECTAACHHYSFHDERRAFATHNAKRMPLKTLQAMMRHVSSQTTEEYIQYAERSRPQPVDLHVPKGLAGMGLERDSPDALGVS